MRASASINKVTFKEYLPVILAAGIFLSFYNPANSGEYSNIAEKSAAAQDTISKSAVESGKEEWRVLKSDYFTIHYRPAADLKAIERKLKKRGVFYVGSASRRSALSGPEGKVADRMDLLFSRAKDILAMHPRVKSIKVKIFSNRKELNDEYYRIFRQKKNYKSFYIYKYNTIYTSEDDILDSVIAHEMGHAIVAHFFVVRPPEKIRELLAQYVDLHLSD